jgi:hypothetical protein
MPVITVAVTVRWVVPSDGTPFDAVNVTVTVLTTTVCVIVVLAVRPRLASVAVTVQVPGVLLAV